MQTAKGAAASAKESAANVAATAKSGMDKTKATVQEKVERMTAHDPTQKEVATDRKQEKIRQAECNKQEARENNAAARQAASTGGTGTFTAVGHAQNTTPGTGIQGNHNYASGGDGLHTHTNTHPTGGHNPGHLTGSGAAGYGTGQHTGNVGGVNAGHQQTHNLGGHNPGHLTGSGAPGYGTGQHTGNVGGANAGYQQTHNLGGVNTAGADAMYPDDTLGAGPNTTRNTVGGAPGMGHGTGGKYQ